MSKRTETILCWSIPITITAVGLYLMPSEAMFVVVVISSAVIGAIDGEKTEFWLYRSVPSLKPIAVAGLMLLIWPVAFPCYLAMRLQIMRGHMTKREEEY